MITIEEEKMAPGETVTTATMADEMTGGEMMTVTDTQIAMSKVAGETAEMRGI